MNDIKFFENKLNDCETLLEFCESCSDDDSKEFYTELIEELQPKWKKFSIEKRNKIKEYLFKNYEMKGNYKKQILNNIKTVREMIYN